MVKIVEGREKKIKTFYPWVQKEEVRRVEGPKKVCLATLEDFNGEQIAIGTYNPISRFPFRVLTLEDEPIDQAFFERKFRTAFELREKLVTDTNAWRAVFSEADQIPGLIIDKYGDHLVVQVRSAGMEMLKPLWLPALIAVSGAESILEKSEMAGRKEEGLEPVAGPLHGTPPDSVEFNETGLAMTALIQDGLKTGYYLDQRSARRELAAKIRPGDKVLDAFCYTGGFSLYAARAGADVTAVDIHGGALAAADRQAQANDLSVDFVEANAFDYLVEGAEDKGPFDWIILDPPAIAKTAQKRDSLKWGVWKLVHAAIPLLKPGGRMLVCSCSYQLSLQKLLDVCRLAAGDNGKQIFVEGVTYQDLDHPAPLSFPESLYLKGVWLRVD